MRVCTRIFFIRNVKWWPDSTGVQKWVPDNIGGTEMDARFYLCKGAQKGVPDFSKGTERGVR